MKIRFTTAIYTHTGGLIRLYIVIWSVLSQFKWLLLFLHHAWRGRGTRLSIRTKDPNNHSDTETGTLSTATGLSALLAPHLHRGQRSRGDQSDLRHHILQEGRLSNPNDGQLYGHKHV